MSTTATQNDKVKRTIGQEIKRHSKITPSPSSAAFLSIVALGIYLAQSSGRESSFMASIAF